MIVYGRNPVREALRGRRRVLRMLVGRAADAAEISSDVDVTIRSAEEIEALCGSADHQGFACETEPYAYVEAAGLLECKDALIVALDQVQDPQNFGAICRTAECAGAAGVVVPERRSVEVTAAVCKASAGAVEHLSIGRVRNLADFLDQAKQAGAWVYGAQAGATVSYVQPDYSGSVVLVLGSEGEGLRPRVAQACDQLVSLPISGKVESLNVSATAAVLIYEARRHKLVE